MRELIFAMETLRRISHRLIFTDMVRIASFLGNSFEDNTSKNITLNCFKNDEDNQWGQLTQEPYYQKLKCTFKPYHHVWWMLCLCFIYSVKFRWNSFSLFNLFGCGKQNLISSFGLKPRNPRNFLPAEISSLNKLPWCS